MKRFSLCLLIMLTLAMVFSAAAGDAAPRLMFSHHRPAGSPLDIDVKTIASRIEKETQGRVAFDVFPAGQLGDYSVVHERIAIGDVACQMAPLAMQTDKQFGIAWFPYLVINMDEARTLYGKNGVVREMINDRLKKQGLVLISTWPAGIGGVCVAKEPKNINDPSKALNGFKIRVMANKVNEYVFGDVLGAIPTSMAWGELFTAMQTGVVDGLQGSASAEGAYSQFRDVTKYYLAYNDHYESFFLSMNEEIWNGISKKDQAIILKVCDEEEAKRWVQAPKDEAIYRKKLADAGVKTIVYKDEDLSKIRDRVAKECWPKVYNEVPKEMLDKALNALKKAK